MSKELSDLFKKSEISDSQNFQNGFTADIFTDQIVHIYDDEIQWNETYYWRVRDIYFNESYGPWTIPNTFFISEKRFNRFIQKFRNFRSTKF